MGNVGLIAGGYIDLKKDGNVRLTIRKAYPHDPVIIELPWHDKKRYQIDIRNSCMKKGVRCEAGDYGNNGNDFYLYNKTFEQPSGRKKYTLHRVQGYKSRHEVALSDRARNLCFTKADKEHIDSNNEAPCGPVCASGGGG